MTERFDPARYEAWYHTRRGSWIGDTEFALLLKTAALKSGGSLLDVGCGSGYFSRRFSDAGLRVAGVDPDPAMLSYARAHSAGIEYAQASANALPFPDDAFDYVTAVTSLCFVKDPLNALEEMHRVSRQRLVLGLLNRNSLLGHSKKGSGGYKGARWDTVAEIKKWLVRLGLTNAVVIRTGIFFPSGGALARCVETMLPGRVSWGGFIAVAIGGKINH